MLTKEQTRTWIAQLTEYYKGDMLEVQKTLEKARRDKLVNNIKYDNLDIGDKSLHLCSKCSLRYVSKASRKTCTNCTVIGGTPNPAFGDYRCITVYKTAKDGVSPGGRCNRAAVKGKKHCHRHGGNVKKSLRRQGKVYMNGRRIYVPSWYDQVLGSTLTDAMKAMEGETPKEVYELEEEVKLTRAAAYPIIHRHSELTEWFAKYGDQYKRDIAATAQSDPEESAEKQRQLNNAIAQLISTGQQVSEAMSKVAAIAQKGDEVYSRHAKTIEIQEIEMVMSQVVKIMWEVCGVSNTPIAEAFEKRLRNEVRLPGIEKADTGATQTADEVLQQMAGTMLLEHK